MLCFYAFFISFGGVGGSRKRVFFKKEKAQVSLEYLILAGACFSVFALMIPIVFGIVDSFLDSSDSIVAKNAAGELAEKNDLLSYLGDGSEFLMTFVPAKEITIYSKEGKVFFASKKSFFESVSTRQEVLKKKFNSKFSVSIRKEAGEIIIEFN